MQVTTLRVLNTLIVVVGLVAFAALCLGGDFSFSAESDRVDVRATGRPK